MEKYAKRPHREWGFLSLLIALQIMLYREILYTQHWEIVTFCELALALISIQLVLLFHDCMHSSLFTKEWNHSFVGRLIGGWYLAPYHFLRYSHLKHHRLAGASDQDTEILHFTKMESKKIPHARVLSWITETPLEPILFAPILQSIHLINLVKSEWKSTLVKNIALDFLVMMLFWTPYVYFLEAHDLLMRGIVFAFLIPFLIGLSLTYLATKPLHSMVFNAPYLDPTIPTEHRHFYVARTIDSNHFLRIIFFNLNFHLEHHLHPTVSRWNLGKLALNMRKDLVRRSMIEGFPLLINRSYFLWFKEFSKLSARYNPVVNRQSLFDENERFEVKTRYTLLNVYYRLP